MAVLVVVYDQVAVQLTLRGITDLTVDQENFLIDLARRVSMISWRSASYYVNDTSRDSPYHRVVRDGRQFWRKW